MAGEAKALGGKNLFSDQYPLAAVGCVVRSGESFACSELTLFAQMLVCGRLHEAPPLAVPKSPFSSIGGLQP